MRFFGLRMAVAIVATVVLIQLTLVRATLGSPLFWLSLVTCVVIGRGVAAFVFERD